MPAAMATCRGGSGSTKRYVTYNAARLKRRWCSAAFAQIRYWDRLHRLNQPGRRRGRSGPAVGAPWSEVRSYCRRLRPLACGIAAVDRERRDRSRRCTGAAKPENGDELLQGSWKQAAAVSDAVL
jgi:hypothetical protein